MDQVISFEPKSFAAQRAQENINLIHLSAEVYTIAVSSNNGQTFLEDRGGTNSNNMTIMKDRLSSFPIRKVPCTTLDSFMERGPSLDVAFIKPDVDKHENGVIK